MLSILSGAHIRTLNCKKHSWKLTVFHAFAIICFVYFYRTMETMIEYETLMVFEEFPDDFVVDTSNLP